MGCRVPEGCLVEPLCQMLLMIGPALAAEPGRARIFDSVARRFAGHFTGQYGRPWTSIHRCLASRPGAA
eukprot:14700765-Alexandrium_andersonii.AAC.1